MFVNSQRKGGEPWFPGSVVREKLKCHNLTLNAVVYTTLQATMLLIIL